MRGERVHHGLWIGLGASLLMHTGAGFVASSISMSRGNTTPLAAGSLDGGVLALDLPSPEVTPPPPDDETLRRMEETLPPESPPPPVIPPTPPRPPRLILGIENSDQITENWLGSADPTPHAAKLSDVNQPQLDTNPGDPGSRAGASAMGPVGPIAPELMPSPAQASIPEKRLKSPAIKAREGASEGDDQPVIGGRPDDRGTAEKTTQSAQGGQPDDARDPTLPGPASRPKGHADKGSENGPDQRTENARPSRPVRAVKPRPGSEGDASENIAGTPRPPGKPGDKPANTPAAESAAAGEASSSPGGGGEHAGEKSEKEADASSTEKAIDIRPGHPAAAQGLDITTKRPYFTRLTSVIAYPGNPLLKVTFNAKGIVTNVVLVESSGFKDVDDPVINAIYEWTAKGKALAELTAGDPKAGITISVRILLR
jgi:hypothetical protein